MTRIAHTITIRRPAEVVWDYLMDTRNDPVWQRNVVQVGRGADAPVEVGLEVEETLTFLGRRFPVVMRVTEHEPPARSAVEIVQGPAPGRGGYEVVPYGPGMTHFTMTFEADDAHGLFRLAEPVFARMLARDMAASCDTLKDVLEAGARRRGIAA